MEHSRAGLSMILVQPPVTNLNVSHCKHSSNTVTAIHTWRHPNCEPCLSLCTSESKQRVYSGHENGDVAVWMLLTNFRNVFLVHRHASGVNALVISHELLLSTSEDCTVHITDSNHMNLLSIVPLPDAGMALCLVDDKLFVGVRGCGVYSMHVGGGTGVDQLAVHEHHPDYIVALLALVDPVRTDVMCDAPVTLMSCVMHRSH